MSSLHNAVEKYYFHHPHIMLTSDTSRNHLPIFLLQGKKEIVYSYLGIGSPLIFMYDRGRQFLFELRYKIDKLFF